MTDVTDADREKAAEIAGWPAKNWTELRDAVAVALAEERVRARAPFLALADEYDDGPEWENATYYGHVIRDRIRRAAEESE